ncbi:MAG: autoinducer binding domain-containing protein [Rhodoferax sp.]|nr:autoinducer binding domain-containing protein [Rhodoferax sp.]
MTAQVPTPTPTNPAHLHPMDPSTPTAIPAGAHALFGPPGRWSLEPVATWLMTQGRHVTEPRAFLGALVEQLDAANARVDRIRISSSTLHPQLAALGVSWSRGEGVQLWSGEHGVQLTDAFRGSPMEHLQQHHRLLHQSVSEQPLNDEHPIWQDLRAAGMRDYVALPMWMGSGRQNAMTVATRNPAGFDDDDIARFTALANLLAPLVELMVGRRTTLGLLETFVGKRIGERILQGQVKRGDGETISAAFWYSDLRGFTALSETLPTDQLLKLLNDYFEYCAAAAASRGGEILQFIGDAILIVFEITEPQRSRQVCAAALDAAIDAFDSIAVVNNRRRRSRQPVIEFGLGLHLGTVTHANVGAPDRLAFNVIGPAVNMTARIQSLTKELQIPLLMSSDFAQQVTNPVLSVGHHAMRGIGHSQELFRLRPE